MIRTVVIDDESKSILTLNMLLEQYCPSVEIVGVAQSVESGIKCIEENKPDLVFLDISMPDGDGFDLLERVDSSKFQVIFTTAYNEYAIKAFQFSALYYLLKPINYKELRSGIDRFEKAVEDVSIADKMEILFDALKQEHKKIILPTSNGLLMIELANIIRCEASGSYTEFFMNCNDNILVSKSMSKFEDILPSSYFCRIHSKHLVNLNYVKQYVKGRGGSVLLENGNNIDVAESRKKEFLKRLKSLSKFLPDMKK